MARWKPGESGNPSGRPVGSEASKFRNKLAKEIPEVLDAVLLKAKAGNLTAAKIILDRCFPPLKPAEQPLPVIAGLSEDTDLEKSITSLLASLIKQELSVNDAKNLIILLSKKNKLLEEDYHSKKKIERNKEYDDIFKI